MDRWYYAKKWFAIFPGFIRPVSATFLHAHYRARSAERLWLRLLIDGIVWLGFLAWVPFRARAIARRFGLGPEWAGKASGIGRRRFLDPSEVAIFRIDSDADADRFMRRFEYSDISKRINPQAWQRECVLADKLRFAARCAQYALPTPAILAHVARRTITINALPMVDVAAVKPTRGVGGAGFALMPLPDREWTRRSFEDWLREHVARRKGDWIVQPKISGHDGLRDIALNALSTARITTMRNERGEIEIVTAALRFAGSATAVVDNVAAGGLLASIDAATGRLDAACQGQRPGDIVSHPISGARIEGRTLPYWAETRALVLRAHREAFAEYAMIGWDVGMAGVGPMLIEGNGKPGLFAAQQAGRAGIGGTRLGDLIVHHLAEAQRLQSHPRGAAASTAAPFASASQPRILPLVGKAHSVDIDAAASGGRKSGSRRRRGS